MIILLLGAILYFLFFCVVPAVVFVLFWLLVIAFVLHMLAALINS